MTIYRVKLAHTATFLAFVEAETREEAIKIAEEGQFDHKFAEDSLNDYMYLECVED